MSFFVLYLAKARIASALVVGFKSPMRLGEAKPRSSRTCRQSCGEIQFDEPFRLRSIASTVNIEASRLQPSQCFFLHCRFATRSAPRSTTDVENFERMRSKPLFAQRFLNKQEKVISSLTSTARARFSKPLAGTAFNLESLVTYTSLEVT